MKSGLGTILMAIAMLTVTGCKTGEGGKCAKPEDCGSGLSCGPRNTCATPEGIECQKHCGKDGKCTLQAGKCVAASDSDCQDASKSCSRYGQCVSDSDCANSSQCSEFSRCVARGGYCEQAAEPR